MIARQDGLLRYVEQHLLEPVLTGESINPAANVVPVGQMSNGQRANQLTQRLHIVPKQIVGDAAVNGLTDEGIVKQRCAHTHGGRSGDHELQRIVRCRDSTLTNDWHIQGFGNFINLMHFQ